MSPSPPAFYLCGPTASGKSACAVALATRIGGEIVNADAFQLYAGLDQLTAKPSADEQAAVPHHLVGVLAPDDACDAQRFRALALPVIQDILARGKWPIVVGGSGLYLKSLTHGLAPLPPADPTVRAELAALTPEARIAELLRLDPAAPDNVPLQNDRYVTRALEICLLTGQPQSALRASWQQDQPTFLGAFLHRERDDLYHRINQRVRTMIETGALDEVRTLLAGPSVAPRHPTLAPDTPLPPDTGLYKAIGVRELATHLRGECTLQEAIAAIQQATRRYAKRQFTWFKREHGFQTVCLTSDSTAQSMLDSILERFPSLLQSPTV